MKVLGRIISLLATAMMAFAAPAVAQTDERLREAIIGRQVFSEFLSVCRVASEGRGALTAYAEEKGWKLVRRLPRPFRRETGVYWSYTGEFGPIGEKRGVKLFVGDELGAYVSGGCVMLVDGVSVSSLQTSAEASGYDKPHPRYTDDGLDTIRCTTTAPRNSSLQDCIDIYSVLEPDAVVLATLLEVSLGRTGPAPPEIEIPDRPLDPPQDE